MIKKNLLYGRKMNMNRNPGLDEPPVSHFIYTAIQASEDNRSFINMDVNEGHPEMVSIYLLLETYNYLMHL